MNKYSQEVSPGLYLDVYDVLVGFKVVCPALQHAIKKLLAPGKRGVKDFDTDMAEAYVSIKRSIAINEYAGCDRIYRRLIGIIEAYYADNRPLDFRIDRNGKSYLITFDLIFRAFGVELSSFRARALCACFRNSPRKALKMLAAEKDTK